MLRRMFFSIVFLRFWTILFNSQSYDGTTHAIINAFIEALTCLVISLRYTYYHAPTLGFFGAFT